MGPFNPVIVFHETLDFLIHFRVDCLSDERLQCISGNAHTRPHDNKGDADAHKSVDVNLGDTKEHNRQNGGAGGDDIPHGIGEDRLHHLGVNLLPQLAVKEPQPQLHPDG